VFRGAHRLAEAPGHTLHHGWAVDGERRAADGSEARLDEVVAAVFRAPRSFTGEDTVEWSCHGGSVPAKRVLGALLAAGARLAGPGEFSLRAFLHGRIDLASSIKGETGGVVGGSGRSRLRSGLVLTQVALTFVLLVGAGLLVRSLQAMRSAHPGFSIEGVMLCGLDLSSAGYDAARARNFQNELLERVRNVGGIASAACARIPPFSYASFSSSPITIEGYAAASDEQPAPEFDEVSEAVELMRSVRPSGADFATKSAPIATAKSATMTARPAIAIRFFRNCKARMCQ